MLGRDEVLKQEAGEYRLTLSEVTFIYSVIIGRPDLTPAELGRQIRACHTGTFWCEGQIRRTKDPAVKHISDTRDFVNWMGLDNDAQCAAWLHDTVEDSGQVGISDIYRHFDEEVGQLVRAVTRIKLPDEQQTLDQYIAQLVQMAIEDPRVGPLKLGDTAANSYTVDGTEDLEWSGAWVTKAAITINESLAGPCREQVRRHLPQHLVGYDILLRHTVRNLRHHYAKVGDPDSLGFAAEFITQPL